MFDADGRLVAIGHWRGATLLPDKVLVDRPRPANSRSDPRTCPRARREGIARGPGVIVVEGVDALERSVGRLFLVVGVFDGLHRGHATCSADSSAVRRHATHDRP